MIERRTNKKKKKHELGKLKLCISHNENEKYLEQ
jgi:hypothetical protein